VFDQSEEALIPRISYPVYETIIRVMRSTITYTGMKGLRIYLEDLARRITPKTKAVLLCNPNKPAGDALLRRPTEASIRQERRWHAVSRSYESLGTSAFDGRIAFPDHAAPVRRCAWVQ